MMSPVYIALLPLCTSLLCIFSGNSIDFLPLNDFQLSFIFTSSGWSGHMLLRSKAMSASPSTPLMSP